MDAPGVGVLLDVDREYREKARAGSLARVAPRRMNPEGKAWLPVLHTRFGPWHFTALFSNTERAHELHRVFEQLEAATETLIIDVEQTLRRLRDRLRS